MRAFIVTAPHTAGVQEVADPVLKAGELGVEVERVGLCGTDVELFTGEMTYFGRGLSRFPVQLGHEWTGRVTATGSPADAGWIGKRITGDTMLGCGECRFCVAGKHHICPYRHEVGITHGWPGALAEQQRIPTRYAHVIPENVSVPAAAMVEPAGNSLRAVDAAGVEPGERLLIIGPGTIGLLAAQIALSRGIDVHVAGTRPSALTLAAELGVRHVHRLDRLGDAAHNHYAAVIDATSLDTSPALAVNVVDPGGRVVFIGISSTPSLIDSRELALKDATAVGILSASPGLDGAIELFASGAVDPEPLIAEVVGLDAVAERLEGRRGPDAGPGPKVHVDPRL